MKHPVPARLFLLTVLLAMAQSSTAQSTPTLSFRDIPLSIPSGSLGFGDFDLDGKADAVGLNNSGLQVYLGKGDGTFASNPKSTPVSGTPAYTFSDKLIVTNVHNRNNKYPGVAFFTSQFNADGTLKDYGVILGDGVGDGTFGLCENDIICLPASPDYTTAPTVLLLASGDFTNDGSTDIAFATQLPDPTTSGLYDDLFYVFTGDGFGDLYPVTLQQNLLPTTVGAVSPNPSAAVADLLGDSYPYLIVNPAIVTSQGSTTLSGLQLAMNNKNGTFVACDKVLLGVSVSQFIPVDINGDRKIDVVYTETTATGIPSTSVKAIFGNGQGQFADPVTLVSALTGMTGTISFSLVDLNQDGDLDIVFSGTSNGIYWASGNGDGTFNTPALITSSDTVSTLITYPEPPLLGLTTAFAWGQKAAYVVQSAPQLQVSASTLTFDGQFVGSTSASQSLTLSNTGGQALTISSIAASTGFADTTNCGATLAPAASCAVQVTFTPSATGGASGTLTIADNAPDSPQVIALTGTGTNITVAAASGSSTSSTITSGGTATYMLTLTPVSGFTGVLKVACTNVPSGYQCSSSAPTVTLASTPQTISFTVAPANSALNRFPSGASSGLIVLSCLMIGFLPRRRLLFLLGSAAFVISLSSFGCGGGGSHSSPTSQTYTLMATFTTSSGSTISQPLTLTVTSK